MLLNKYQPDSFTAKYQEKYIEGQQADEKTEETYLNYGCRKFTVIKNINRPDCLLC